MAMSGEYELCVDPVITSSLIESAAVQGVLSAHGNFLIQYECAIDRIELQPCLA